MTLLSREQFEDLLSRVVDGDATYEEFTAFQDALRKDNSFFNRYVEEARVNALIRLARRNRGAISVLSRARRRLFFRKAVSFASIAATLAILLTAELTLRHTGMPKQTTGRTAALARQSTAAGGEGQQETIKDGEGRQESTAAGRGFSTAIDRHGTPSTAIAETPPRPFAPEGVLHEQIPETKKEQIMKNTTAGMARMGIAAAALAIATSNTVGLLSASALEYTWLSSPYSAIWNTTDQNWDKGSWADGNLAIFGTSNQRDITLDGIIGATGLSVTDGAYSFTNGTLNLEGPVAVSEGASATVASAVLQTNGTLSARFEKTGTGTLTLTGGTASNLFCRLKLSAGTLTFSGGKHIFTQEGADGTDSGAAFVQAGGTLRVTGGASVGIPGGATRSALQSDGVLNIENGTVGATNLFFFNGVSSTTGKSVINIGNGGKLLANTLQVSGSTIASGTNEVCINVTTGGILQVKGFKDDSVLNNYGTLFFDGGQFSTRLYNGETLANSGGMIPVNGFSKTHFKIGKGGLYIRDFMSGRGINGPLESGAAQDGGIHIEGNGVFYPRGNNTYNGGTWLNGPNVVFCPAWDSNLGAVPDSPTNNLFFQKTCWIFAQTKFVTHTNRNIQIAADATASLTSDGDSNIIEIHGTISGDNPACKTNGTLLIGSKWNSAGGPIVLVPPPDRTNQIGRLLVREHNLIVGSGTTLVDGSGFGSENGTAGLDILNATFSVTGGLVRVLNAPSITVRGHLEVSAGTLDFGNHEILNAFRLPGTTTVCNAGTIICGSFRVSQMDGTSKHGCLNVCTGGVLRLNFFSGYWGQTGEVNLNGGTLEAKVTTDDWFGHRNTYFGDKATNFIYVCEGGAIFNTAGYNVTITDLLRSGAEHDGGLTKIGTGTLTLTNACAYTGITKVKAGTLRLARSSNCLPPTNTVAICAGARLDTFISTGVYGTQTLARVEGAGTFSYSSNITVTDSLAPGDGTNGVGTLTFQNACALGGRLEIDGNVSNADCLVVSSGVQDISKLFVNVNDFKSLNKDKVYTIFNAKDGYTGKFASRDAGKSTSWFLRYNKDGKTVSLAYRKGTVVMLM